MAGLSEEKRPRSEAWKRKTYGIPPPLGSGIRNGFGLWHGNDELLSTLPPECQHPDSLQRSLSKRYGATACGGLEVGLAVACSSGWCQSASLVIDAFRANLAVSHDRLQVWRESAPVPKNAAVLCKCRRMDGNPPFGPDSGAAYQIPYWKTVPDAGIPTARPESGTGGDDLGPSVFRLVHRRSFTGHRSLRDRC